MSLKHTFPMLLIVLSMACQTQPTAQARKPSATAFLSLEKSQRQNADIVSINSVIKDQIQIDIEKHFGIGSATINLVGQKWPESVKLDFHNFQALEKFEISSAAYKLELSIHQTDKVEIKRLMNGLRITQKKDLISIKLPAKFLRNADKKMAMKWIDFYR